MLLRTHQYTPSEILDQNQESKNHVVLYVAVIVALVLVGVIVVRNSSSQQNDAMNFDDPEMSRVVSDARAALVARMAPSQAVTRAGTMLRMVEQGLHDMQETDQDRIHKKSNRRQRIAKCNS